MDDTSIPTLVARLGAEEDSTRKMAVFKLQSAIGDPSFADVFISEGGLPKLRALTLSAGGNTLAYSLSSVARLLELDKGWDVVNQELIGRAVELVVTQPLVNILRGAMAILGAIVSQNHGGRSTQLEFGFKALKPSIDVYPSFLEKLVSRLSSADHLLCANALQLINGLMRDALTNDQNTEWFKFIKKLQDLGVIKAVYNLMQSTALQDLAQPLLEFQFLTKIMLRKWRDVHLDLEKSDHRRALNALQTASYGENQSRKEREGSKKHHPEKWRRLGFQSEDPGWEFEKAGFLGMMDITDFVRKYADQFQKLLLEQSAKPAEQRCPIARASLAVTEILYDHFEVEKSESEDVQRYVVLESRSNFERAFRPLLLHWSRLHTAGLNAFLRLWKATGAEVEDFEKVEELVRILVEQVVGQAPRIKDVHEIEEEMSEFDYSKLRSLQMELLELTYEDAWGHHLRQVREELNHEALQFVKEQRVRCLLQGSWFPHVLNYETENGPITKQNLNRPMTSSWRYVRLSHNRRYLHYADFEKRLDMEPGLDILEEKVDLSIVSSVVSNVSSQSPPTSSSSNETIKQDNPQVPTTTSTKITIHGYLPTTGSSQQNSQATQKETPLLHLHPQSHTLASEWLDGLLMLLNQQPITNDTNKLVNLIGGYGIKIRLLNVRFEDLAGKGNGEEPVMPGREGVDGEFWYEIGGMEGGA
ncbi:hypothetical protein K402DRAFT_390678 [Aulographum hederae CBS 113979]|uniref:ELMO domain-containing protein n=1 Tax=Aulographum hederae CBS 113979 TaxID=1176131 RepID=A0A6G1H930_9PEZI|nr:hypothetical protein K402DRAFT_390678 [Aulographum hederae CBS 113979]